MVGGLIVSREHQRLLRKQLELQVERSSHHGKLIVAAADEYIRQEARYESMCAPRPFPRGFRVPATCTRYYQGLKRALIAIRAANEAIREDAPEADRLTIFTELRVAMLVLGEAGAALGHLETEADPFGKPEDKLASLAAQPRHAHSSSHRDVRKVNGRRLCKMLRMEAKTLRRPGKSDRWIAQQIERMPIAKEAKKDGLKAATIRTHIRKKHIHK